MEIEVRGADRESDELDRPRRRRLLLHAGREQSLHPLRGRRGNRGAETDCRRALPDGLAARGKPGRHDRFPPAVGPGATRSLELAVTSATIPQRGSGQGRLARTTGRVGPGSGSRATTFTSRDNIRCGPRADGSSDTRSATPTTTNPGGCPMVSDSNPTSSLLECRLLDDLPARHAPDHRRTRSSRSSPTWSDDMSTLEALAVFGVTTVRTTPDRSDRLGRSRARACANHDLRGVPL